LTAKTKLSKKKNSENKMLSLGLVAVIKTTKPIRLIKLKKLGVARSLIIPKFYSKEETRQMAGFKRA